MLTILLSMAPASGIQWSRPQDVGIVHWGVSAGRAFSSQYAAFGIAGGTVASMDRGKTFAKVSNYTISEYMVPCTGTSVSCDFHDFGTPKLADSSNTSWISESATFWKLTDDQLIGEKRSSRITFSGLPFPSKPQKFTENNGLRFGGSATVVLPAGSVGGSSSHPTFLQTAIVSWPPQTANDSVATSIVVFTSHDGFAFTYLGTVASAADNPSSDEGPNEHAMEVLADGSLLCVFRVDCGDGTHHPSGQWGRFAPYVQTRSRDGGRHWTRTEAAVGAPGCAYPHLLRLPSGPLLLSGGRSIFSGTDDNDLWVSWGGDGASWERHALSGPHNAGARPGMPQFDAKLVNTSQLSHRQTVAYTSLVTAGPSSALIGYEFLDGDCNPDCVHYGFAMRADFS
jgi:hypothetical protein